jgi:hypothetical protein
MFGHHDVAHQREAKAIANRAQQRQAPVTTEGDGMQMSTSVVADQSFAHGKEEKSKPRPFQSKGSSARNSQTDSSALTYWSGIIQ